MKLPRLISDQNGAVLVEATVMITLTLIFLLGSVDFLLAFYQWNMANKAAQFGSRIAAVSDPVASDLPAFAAYTGLSPGDAMPAVPPNTSLFQWTCDGATATCSGTSTAYDADAMNTIVFGRAPNGSANNGNTSCIRPQPNLYKAGMCNIFSRIGVANVKITYSDTGLGFAFRPGGPVATVVVSLQNLPFHFFFLSGLMGFGDIDIPAEATSITGEDLSSDAPP